jgi:hypothetical protein
MRWRKLGHLFSAPTHLGWAQTHAQLPFAEPLGAGWRVHFSSRDERGRAQIGSFELDLDGPAPRVGAVRTTPEIGLGPLGAFDDNGVTTSWVLARGGARYHYYTGWTLGVTVPFYLGIGLAVSEDDGDTYRKVFDAPVLGRSGVDPYLTASPAILVENGIWRMWYVSCDRWALEAGQPKHLYHIRYAESADGINWKPLGHRCIDFKTPDEYAISRPTVVKDGTTYKMWYGHRASTEGGVVRTTYRIGYAESKDGLSWTRRDEDAGIDVSPEGWDSEMIEYPHVFDHRERRYMLYNGNGYSRTGMGLAVLE